MSDGELPGVGPIMVFTARRADVARFYAELLGIAADPSDGATWLEAANAKLAIHDPGDRQTPPEVHAQRGFVVWFAVHDVRAAYGRAEAANAVVGGFHGDFFFARDPDGRHIGVFESEEHGHDHHL